MFRQLYFHARTHDDIRVAAQLQPEYGSISVYHPGHDTEIHLYLNPDQIRYIIDALEPVATPKSREPIPLDNTDFALCETPEEMRATMLNIIQSNVRSFAVEPAPKAVAAEVGDDS